MFKIPNYRDIYQPLTIFTTDLRAIRLPLRSADSAASAPATRQGVGRGVLPAENAGVSDTKGPSMIFFCIIKYMLIYVNVC